MYLSLARLTFVKIKSNSKEQVYHLHTATGGYDNVDNIY